MSIHLKVHGHTEYVIPATDALKKHRLPTHAEENVALTLAVSEHNLHCFKCLYGHRPFHTRRKRYTALCCFTRRTIPSSASTAGGVAALPVDEQEQQARTIEKVMDFKDWDSYTPASEQERFAEMFLLVELHRLKDHDLIHKAWRASTVPQGRLVRCLDDMKEYFVIRTYGVAILLWPAVLDCPEVWVHDMSVKRLTWRCVFSVDRYMEIPTVFASPLRMYLKAHGRHKGYNSRMYRLLLFVMLTKILHMFLPRPQYRKAAGTNNIDSLRIQVRLARLKHYFGVYIPRQPRSRPVQDRHQKCRIASLQIGPPRKLMKYHAYYGCSGLSEDTMEEMLKGICVLPDVGSAGGDYRTEMSLALISKAEPTWKDADARRALNRGYALENPDMHATLLADPDLIGSVLNNIEARKLAEYAKSLEIGKAKRSHFAASSELRLPRYFKTAAPKAKGKAKAKAKANIPRWLPDKDPRTADVTRWLEKYKPPTVAIVEDDYNGRWRVISEDSSWRSISWTKRGFRTAALEVLRFAWTLEFATTGDVPDFDMDLLERELTDDIGA